MNESSKMSSFSFLNNLKELFYKEMDQQTSACLYGSALTEDWAYGRSDLDLFLVVPESKLALLGAKIKTWQSNPSNPILDGFVLYSSATGTMVREFHKFEKSFLLDHFIPLIDLWNVKNRSKHLFGQDVKIYVQEISQLDLKSWAFKDIKNYWIPLLNNVVYSNPELSQSRIPLSSLILISSGVARTIMLTKGNICSSKRKALEWLADEYIEINDFIDLLIINFEIEDDKANSLTTSQAIILVKYYLAILRET